MKADIKLRLADWPEAMHSLVFRLARMLREEADAEAHPAAQEALRRVAARFETGLERIKGAD